MSFWISGWGTQGRCRYSAVSLITRFDFMAPVTRVITALQCKYNNLVLYLAIATIYSLFDHVYKYMGDQLCAKKILNNHWISGVPILKGLIRILKSLKFCLVNTETTVKFIWSSGQKV